MLPAVIREWQLTQPQAGLVGTTVFLGVLAGAWFWGTISDYIGRRPTLAAYLLLSGVFTYIFAVVSGLNWIVIAAV